MAAVPEIHRWYLCLCIFRATLTDDTSSCRPDAIPTEISSCMTVHRAHSNRSDEFDIIMTGGCKTETRPRCFDS